MSILLIFLDHIISLIYRPFFVNLLGHQLEVEPEFKSLEVIYREIFLFQITEII